jgi:hypothetical protein
VILSLIAGGIYAPAMNPCSRDQLMYFAEVGGHDSLARGLRHVDYAISRVCWKGDDLLFRPILFTWLAIANRLFPTITSGGTWRTSPCTSASPSRSPAPARDPPLAPAAPAAVLFLVLEPPMELVLWNHLGGYLLACLFLAIGLRSFVRRLDGSTTSCAGFAIAFSLACLSYEAMVPIAAAAALILLVKHRRANGGGDVALLVAPVALYAALYGFHALHAPRLGYVDRADGRSPFDLANIGSVLNGIQRMLEAWIRELAMPTALRLWAAPFERFGKNFHIALSEPFQILNLVVVLLALFVLARTASRARFRQAAPLVLLLIIAIFAYAFIIAFGRSADEVAAITYYSYVFSVLAVPLVYTLVDFGRISPSMMTVAAALLCAFAAVHAAGTVANVREVRQANRFASLFLTRVITFVDAHRSEPGFSFAIEPHPEGVDPIVGLVVGYPSDPGRQVLQRRVTEIIFAPDYTDRDPKYVLSASGDRVVNRSR